MVWKEGKWQLNPNEYFIFDHSPIFGDEIKGQPMNLTEVKKTLTKEGEKPIQIHFSFVEENDIFMNQAPLDIGDVVSVYVQRFFLLSPQHPAYQDSMTYPKIEDGKLFVLDRDLMDPMFINLIVKEINSILCRDVF